MKAFVSYLDKLLGWVTAGILAVTFALLVYGVVARYILNISGLNWAFEVTIFAIAWAILLSVSRIEHRNAHIRMDILLQRLGTRSRFLSELLSISASIMLSGFFVYSGYFVVVDSIMWNERSGSSLRLPMWIYFSALSVSFGLHLVFLIARLMQILHTGEVVEPDDLAANADG